MPLPIQPEHDETLKARIPAALETEVDAKFVIANPHCSPTKQPKHVFDTVDGIRFGLSRDLLDGKRFIHFSFSLWNAKLWAGKVPELKQRMRQIRDWVTRSKETEFATSPKGVLHYLHEPTE